MIVSLDQFNTYTNNNETSAEVDAMKEQMLKSAQEIVSRHLGYNVENEVHDDYICGIGQPVLFLFGYPVTEVLSLSLSGADIPVTEVVISGRGLRLKSGVWPEGLDNVHVVYKAGWTCETVPETVKMTILQIASLMLAESGGNIGITGKSMPENSRTFINYTNYDKWLNKLNEFMVIRLVD